MPVAQAFLRCHRRRPAARVYMPFIAILKPPFKIARPYLPQQPGKRQRMTRQSVGGLGPYPDVTLAEAREAAAEQRKLLRDGIDPIVAKRAQRAAQAAEAAKSITFEECADQFITMKQAEWKHAGKSARHSRSSPHA